MASRRGSLYAEPRKIMKARLDESIQVVNKHRLLPSANKKTPSKVKLNTTTIKQGGDSVNPVHINTKNVTIKLKSAAALNIFKKKLQSHRGSVADLTNNPFKKSQRGSVDLLSKARGVSPGTNLKTNPVNTPKKTRKIDVARMLGSALKAELEKRQSRVSMHKRPTSSTRGASGGSINNTKDEESLIEKLLKEKKKGSKEHKKVINVSIHHNFNNVCYAPIYIRQQYHLDGEEKSKRSAPAKKNYSHLSNTMISESPDSEKFSESFSIPDPFSLDREKLTQHNKLWFHNNEEVPRTTLEYYTFVKLIGKGAFGRVTLGVHKLTGKYVAIKTIEKKYMKDEFSRRKVFQEVYILKKIRHAHVIRLLEVFEDKTNMLIVMEYAAGGDLLKYVRTKGPLPETEARGIFRQVVYGMGHVHSRSVLHRDIKLDNILLDQDHSVKICDFGVSKIMKKKDVVKEQCGTPAYIAPEVITGEGYTGFYIDHWSLGILLYAMLSANVPFRAKNMQELLKVIKETPVSFPVKMPEQARDLINSLLRINPKERLSIPEILAHPWMQEEILEGFYQNSSVFVNSKDCEDDAEAAPNINVVNIENIFFRDKGTEKLSYTDYCAIGNDMYTYKIEEEALKTMEGLGYPRKVVIDGLQKGELNHATATYNLLVLP